MNQKPHTSLYNIVLIGFMGTGKTVISEQLGRSCGMEIIDMDKIISEREGISIQEIFSICGEEYFRDLETNLLIELQSKQNCIISCGGGAVMRDGNVQKMKNIGNVFLLKAKPETVYERIKNNDDRPLLKGRKSIESISELMEMRRLKYEAAADIIIETDHKSIEEICIEIINRNKGD